VSSPISKLHRILRDPLLHFALLGCALFLIQRLARGDAAAPRERTVVVGPEVRRDLEEQWTTQQGRPPTVEELDREVARWTDDEILFREGTKLGLDRGDPMIRDRVAYKMASILRSQIVLPEATEAELLARYERDPTAWAKAERYDFTHVFVNGLDDAAKTRANELLETLRQGADPARLGDTFQGGRRYRGRKIEDLGKAFGESFVAGLGAQAVGTWELRTSRFGYHLVRLDKKSAASASSFEAVRADVLKAFDDERRDAAFASKMTELRAKWEVEARP
jgi:hypothetical protein